MFNLFHIGLALAQETCVSVYGGGVVCGVHTPVETGLGLNPALVGLGFLAASGAALYLARRIRKA